MFGFGKHNAGVLYGALFDVGSESVGVAIVASDRGSAIPKVIFNHRTPIKTGREETPYSDQLRFMREALFSASLVLSRDGVETLRSHNPHAKVGKILVSVGAPWSHTVPRNVVYKSDTDIKITKELVDDLIKSAEDEVRAHVDALTQNVPDKPIIVERTTTDIRLNDYSIEKPFGLKGKEVSLVHITGLVPEHIMEIIHEVEEKLFPHTSLQAHTFMLMHYCVLREIIRDHADLTIMHITGESTEFGIVENDTLVETFSVPFGINHILRTLMQNDLEHALDARTLLTRFAHEELVESAATPVQTSLSAYMQALSETLEKEAGGKRFPKHLALLAPDPYGPLFKQSLMPFITETLKIETTPEILSDRIIKETAYEESADAHLTITARFFHKLHGCGEIQTV